MKDYYIEKVHAREILDSRGNPTVMVEAHINGCKKLLLMLMKI